MPVDRGDSLEKVRPTRHPRASRTGNVLRRWFWTAWFLLVAPSTASPVPGPDWIDDLLERIVPRERIGIPHCGSMVSAQLRLASARDTVRQILSTGIPWRHRCETMEDSIASKACFDSLASLRSELGRYRSVEHALMDSVRIHAARCNPASFKAWQDWRTLENTPDSLQSDSTIGMAPFDRLLEMEFAAVWSQERRERLREPNRRRRGSGFADHEAFRDRMRKYMGRRGAQTPSAQSYFLLAVLDHREGDDDQALFRLRRIPARDTSTAWKGPVALLYGQILSPTSPDSAIPLLETALSDPKLASPALYLLAQIEERRHRPAEALARLAAYLDLPPAPSPGSRELAIQAAARSLVALADPPYRIKEILDANLPRNARDTIGLAVARQLLTVNAPKQSIELLGGFQVTFPGTKLGEEARMLLSQIRRNRPGIVVR